METTKYYQKFRCTFTNHGNKDCAKQFTSPIILMEHVLKFHHQEFKEILCSGPYICPNPFCFKSYKSKQWMKNHLKTCSIDDIIVVIINDFHYEFRFKEQHMAFQYLQTIYNVYSDIRAHLHFEYVKSEINKFNEQQNAIQSQIPIYDYLYSQPEKTFPFKKIQKQAKNTVKKSHSKKEVQEYIKKTIIIQEDDDKDKDNNNNPNIDEDDDIFEIMDTDPLEYDSEQLEKVEQELKQKEKEQEENTQLLNI